MRRYEQQYKKIKIKIKTHYLLQTALKIKYNQSNTRHNIIYVILFCKDL